MPTNITTLESLASSFVSSTDTTVLSLISSYNTLPLSSNSVVTFSTLPSAANNTGRFMYATDTKKWYFSNGTDWANIKAITAVGGVAYSWGLNTWGQLGDGTQNNRSSPGTIVGTNSGWLKIELGTSRGVGIKVNGTLWTWGLNGSGSLGDGTTTSRTSPGTTAGGGTNWIDVGTGETFSAGVKNDGTLWTWGSNTNGQLGDNTTTSRSSPGTTAGGGTTWSKVVLGPTYTLAIKSDGTLWTWGNNFRGQLGDNTTTSRSSPGTTAGGGTTWSSASAGYDTSAAIKTDGTLWTWGRNYAGRLGDGTTTNRSSPVTTAGGGTTWSSVTLGNTSSAGIKTDGTLWTWGFNGYGTLGTGNTTSRRSPGTTAGGGTNWSVVDLGLDTIAATKTDGTLWTWGLNGSGQLGDGTTTARSSPGTTAAGGTDWTSVVVGQNFTFGLK